jgi:hypothetical protein
MNSLDENACFERVWDGVSFVRVGEGERVFLKSKSQLLELLYCILM